jgi:predicted ATPase
MTKHVLTGGPCSGKSTVLALLKARGYTTIDEAAKQVRQEQERVRNPILPHTHPAAYQVLVDARQRYFEEHDIMPRLHMVQVFLDRSRVDQIGYCIAYNIEVPSEVQQSVRRVRYGKIFLLETLPDHCYVNESFRPEDRAESLRIADCLHEGYLRTGYEPIVVPFAPPEERMEMILKHIGGAT